MFYGFQNFMRSLYPPLLIMVNPGNSIMQMSVHATYTSARMSLPFILWDISTILSVQSITARLKAYELIDHGERERERPAATSRSGVFGVTGASGIDMDACLGGEF